MMVLLSKGAWGGGGGALPLGEIAVAALVAVVIYVAYGLVVGGFEFFSVFKLLHDDIDESAEEFGTPRLLTKIVLGLILLAGIAVWVAILIWTTWLDRGLWLAILYPIAFIIGLMKFWGWYSLYLVEHQYDRHKGLWLLTGVMLAVLTGALALIWKGLIG